MTAGLAAGKAGANSPDPLITEVQDWASYTGEGVDETPYGLPIEFEADGIFANRVQVAFE